MTRIRIVARTFLVLLALAAAPENSQARDNEAIHTISPMCYWWESSVEYSTNGVCKIIGPTGNWSHGDLSYLGCVAMCSLTGPLM